MICNFRNYLSLCFHQVCSPSPSPPPLTLSQVKLAGSLKLPAFDNLFSTHISIKYCLLLLQTYEPHFLSLSLQSPQLIINHVVPAPGLLPLWSIR